MLHRKKVPKPNHIFLSLLIMNSDRRDDQEKSLPADLIFNIFMEDSQDRFSAASLGRFAKLALNSHKAWFLMLLVRLMYTTSGEAYVYYWSMGCASEMR